MIGGVHLAMHLLCELAIELSTEMLRQRLLVGEVTIHRHLGAAYFLRDSPHREVFVSVFDKEPACSFNEPRPKTNMIG
jgi:hypothetical protein